MPWNDGLRGRIRMLTATTRIRPLGDHVVVAVDEREKVTPGGIHLPDASREKQSIGRVIAVGRGLRQPDGDYEKPEVDEGDRVLFAKYSGTQVESEEKNLVVLRAVDIVAVLDDTSGE
jgi:chaperonin GroES